MSGHHVHTGGHATEVRTLLIVLGDQDIVKPEPAFELTQYPEVTARLIEEFLDSE